VVGGAVAAVGERGPVVGQDDAHELDALASEVELVLAGLDASVRFEAVRRGAHWLAARASWA
jgi:hypothetical protein